MSVTFIADTRTLDTPFTEHTTITAIPTKTAHALLTIDTPTAISPIASSCIRDLSSYLDTIWQRYFADIPRMNEVQIAYCYPWKSRLGLIRLSLDNTRSFIGVNALLQHRSIPEVVLTTTIAHELAHYAHGFGSPLPRRYEHPHANGVVDRELEQRSLGTHLRASNAWIDDEWYAFYERQRATGWAEIRSTHRAARRHK